MRAKLSSLYITRNTRNVLFSGFAAVLCLFTSCTKQTSAPADNAKFLGTWVGAQVCYMTNPESSVGFVGTVTQENIGAGSDGNSLIIGVSFGAGTCYLANYVTATAKNNDFSFARTGFFDNCGNSYSIAGTGSLNTAGTTLTVTTYVIGPSNSDSCIFTGTK